MGYGAGVGVPRKRGPSWTRGLEGQAKLPFILEDTGSNGQVFREEVKGFILSFGESTRVLGGGIRGGWVLKMPHRRTLVAPGHI